MEEAEKDDCYSPPFHKASVFTDKIFVTPTYSNMAQGGPTPVFKDYSGMETTLADQSESKI